MGCNYYVEVKCPYHSELDARFPYEDWDGDVRTLENGYVWHNRYYATEEDLNKDYYVRLHIGKSSAGWCFGLRCMPQRGINGLEDWKKIFAIPGAIIKDEDGDVVSEEEFENRVKNKSSCFWRDGMTREEFEAQEIARHNEAADHLHTIMRTQRVNTYDEYLRSPELGGAKRGPRGLLRHASSYHHPVEYPSNLEESYDLIIEDGNYGW